MRKYISTTIGLIGVFGVIVTIYSSFFQSRDTNLSMEIINANTISNKNLKKNLKFFYGDSLFSDNLHLISIKISNDSKYSVQSNYYDPNNPIGIFINGNFVEEPTVLDCSNSLKGVNPILNFNDSIVYFKNLVLKNGDYFTTELFVKSSFENLDYRAVGNISSQNTIEISEDKPIIIGIKHKWNLLLLTFLTALSFPLIHFLMDLYEKSTIKLKVYCIIYIYSIIACFGLYTFMYTSGKDEMDYITFSVYLFGAGALWTISINLMLFYYPGYKYSPYKYKLSYINNRKSKDRSSINSNDSTTEISNGNMPS